MKRMISCLLLALTIVGCVSCSVFASDSKTQTSTTSTQTTTNSKVLLYAHRGFSSKYPENTLIAFKQAYKNGFDGVECDVWESNNGDLMIFHDSNLSRMCGKNIKIWKINSQNRKNYPILKSKYKNYTGSTLYIPTFQEVAKIVKKYGGKIFIHLKGSQNTKQGISNNGIKKLEKIIRKYGIQKQFMMFCESKYMASIKNKSYKTGVVENITNKAYTKNVVRKLIKYKMNYYITKKGVPAFKAYSDATYVPRLCTKYSIKTGPYTITTNEEYNYLKTIGANFAMSNYMVK